MVLMTGVMRSCCKIVAGSDRVLQPDFLDAFQGQQRGAWRVGLLLHAHWVPQFRYSMATSGHQLRQLRP
mgnify:CR=1 FL=1